MSDFIFRVSPNVIIASYSASRLGEFALEYGKRFMMVLDPVLRSVGLAEKITQSLTDRNVDFFVFDELGEVSDSKTIDAAVKLARSSHIQGVIAAGGGKAVSVGRAVAALFNEKADIYSFLDGNSVTASPLPLIALCTTCREANAFTDKIPLTDSRSNQLKVLKVSNSLCRAAVFDPNMSVTLTDNQTESMELESLCLAAESYFSQKANFFSDMLAQKSAELLHLTMDGSESLTVTSPKEELRVQGGCLAGIASSASSFGPAGLLAMAINARFKISRSLVASILFPYVIEDCAKFKTDRVSEFAGFFGIEGAEGADSQGKAQTFADNIRQRMAKANLPTRLKDLSVSIEQLALAAEDAGKLEYANYLPRSMTSDDLFELIKAAY